jgi:threonine dehydratase
VSALVTAAAIQAARERLIEVLQPVPTYRSDTLSRLTGRAVLIKPEFRQRTGSFKIRGAFNLISQLQPGREVVAASAGNHAQGVALAAALTGRTATIFMPEGASLPKINATRGYGATVRLEGGILDDAIGIARGYADAAGATFVPPFDDLDVIAGQGTLGLEVVEEAPDAEVILVPVGGGGLLGGVGAAVASACASGFPARRRPSVIGVEAAGAPTMSAALAAGRPVRLSSVSTMADGIAVGCVSETTLAHAESFVDAVLTVDEEEISRAILLGVERLKAVVEPAGAVGLAALASGRVPGEGPVVVVLSGGNVDPMLLAKLIDHGLSAAGRYLTLRVVVGDRAGSLASVTADLARLGLNVLDVEHHRNGRPIGVGQVEIQVTVETRDRDHHAEVIGALEAAGHHATAVL